MNRIRLKWWLILAVVMCIALGAGSAWAAGAQGLGAVGPLDANG